MCNDEYGFYDSPLTIGGSAYYADSPFAKKTIGLIWNKTDGCVPITEENSEKKAKGIPF